jgi:hypothetical protein
MPLSFAQPEAAQLVGKEQEPVSRESEAHPAVSSYFGQRFPAAHRRAIEKKNVPPGTKVRMYCGMKLGITRLP